MQAARALTLSSKRSLFSDSNKVLCKISNAIRGINNQWRGRSSSAASVPSKSDRCQKRVSKDERRAIVESFVDKYRASNAGKFPTPSTVKKEVGGSYYVVKNIIEELEQQTRVSPPVTKEPYSGDKEEFSTGITRNEAEAKIKPQKLHRVEKPLFEEIPIHVEKPLFEEIPTHVEKPLFEEIPTHVQKPLFEEIPAHVEKPFFEQSINLTRTDDDSSVTQTQCHQMGLESTEKFHQVTEKQENSIKEEVTSEGSSYLNDLKEEGKLEADHKILESEKLPRDTSREVNKEDLLPERSTLWGNLKSLAGGIAKFWRNG